MPVALQAPKTERRRSRTRSLLERKQSSSAKKERSVKIDVPPLNFAGDAIEGMAAVTDAMAEGQITPSEGAAFSSMISGYSYTLQVADLSKRIEALEASQKSSDEK
jgi:hypothetical protein